MHEPRFATQLTYLATEVDSLEKAVVQAQAERARESERRQKADLEAQDLRQQLRIARRRAKQAERELAQLNAEVEGRMHRAQETVRGLRAELEHERQRNEVLQHDVQRVERERRALQLNLREVLGNLRQAARETGGTLLPPVPADDTLVPVPHDDGW